MSVCAHRGVETPGFFTPCARPGEGCRCGRDVEADLAGLLVVEPVGEDEECEGR